MLLTDLEVYNISSRPLILECASFGAMLALPDADLFECAYCCMRMVYILSPFGNQVYANNPDGSFNFSFDGEGDPAGQFNFSTGLMTVTEQDKLVISDVNRVDLFDAMGNNLNQMFTIDYNVAEGSMFGMTIDSQGDLYFISSCRKVLKYEMN